MMVVISLILLILPNNLTPVFGQYQYQQDSCSPGQADVWSLLGHYYYCPLEVIGNRQLRTKQRGKSSHGNVTYFYLDLPSGQIFKDPVPDKLQYSCIHLKQSIQFLRSKIFQFPKTTYKPSHDGQFLWDPDFDRRNQNMLKVIQCNHY